MARAKAYGFQGGQATDPNAANALVDAQGGGCAQAADDLPGSGVPGKVTLAPGADRPGVATKQLTLRFVAQMAGLYGKPITVTTGTNHSQYTTTGGVSDHWDGYGADIGMAANGGTDGGIVGDRIMTACLIAGGEPPGRAREQATRGGLYTLYPDGFRVQCIWKTYAGGNHYNHVHAGIRPDG